MSGLYPSRSEGSDAEHPEPPQPSGCGPRLAGVLIVFFVNVPLVNLGWSKLWHTAPVLLVVALVVDVFLLLMLVLWWVRRRRVSLPEQRHQD